jgi:hypothetical protein
VSSKSVSEKLPSQLRLKGHRRLLDNLIFDERDSLFQRFREGEFLAKKKGEKYKCEECGLVVLVENPCACEPCDIVCCHVPMKPVKEEKAKAKPKAKAKK